MSMGTWLSPVGDRAFAVAAAHLEQSAPTCHVRTFYICFPRSHKLGFPLQAFLSRLFAPTTFVVPAQWQFQLSLRTLTAFLNLTHFLPRDALVHSAVLRLHVVRLSVRPSVRLSVTLVDQDHIGWKSWKLIAWTHSPTPSLFVAQRPSTYSQGNMGKFGGD